MARVTGVRAQPGGPVALDFTADGYRVHRRDGVINWLLDDLGCFTSLVVAGVFGVGAVYAYEYDLVPLAIVLAALAVPGAFVVTVRLAAEVAAEVLGYLMIGLTVLASPLLVFPSVRRWARKWWSGSTRPTSTPRRRTPASAVTDAELRRDGATVTVLLEVDGERVRYQATGIAGERLEGEVRTLLADRLRTVH
ncbi:hypothetical protein [Plantactinospora sp. GCM10030261]|uniref:hypothetical protein n=1 Tax=Plantactinospora sp. GCM10030261 TaxID=3273420 RepID=UPI003619A03F